MNCPMPDWMMPDPHLLDPSPIGDYGDRPPIDRGEGLFNGPKYIPPTKPDIDPGFSPHLPFGPGSGSGFGWHGAMMMSAGYNDPNFGLPSDSGGSFIGTAICYAPCCIPPDIQPAIPPDGLFGPDTPLPGWGFPGYVPPPDKTSPFPIMPKPPSRDYMLSASRQQSAIWDPGDTFDFVKEGSSNLPGTRPSLNLPGFGLTVTSYDDFLNDVIFAKYGPPVRKLTLRNRMKNSGAGISTSTSDSSEIPNDTSPSQVIATGSGKYNSTAVSYEDGKEIPWDESLVESENYNKGNYTDPFWGKIKRDLGDSNFKTFVNEVIPWYEASYRNIVNRDIEHAYNFNTDHDYPYGEPRCRTWSQDLENYWYRAKQMGLLKGWEGTVYSKLEGGHWWFAVNPDGNVNPGVVFQFDPQTDKRNNRYHGNYMLPLWKRNRQYNPRDRRYRKDENANPRFHLLDLINPYN